MNNPISLIWIGVVVFLLGFYLYAYITCKRQAHLNKKWIDDLIKDTRDEGKPS